MQAYLEDFYKFCQELGGTTAEVMGEILQVTHLTTVLSGSPVVVKEMSPYVADNS